MALGYFAGPLGALAAVTVSLVGLAILFDNHTGALLMMAVMFLMVVAILFLMVVLIVVTS